jgi:hypothetical protein
LGNDEQEVAAADGTTFRLNRFIDPALIRQLAERFSGSVLGGLHSLDLQEVLQSISLLKGTSKNMRFLVLLRT